MKWNKSIVNLAPTLNGVKVLREKSYSATNSQLNYDKKDRDLVIFSLLNLFYVPPPLAMVRNCVENIEPTKM